MTLDGRGDRGISLSTGYCYCLARPLQIAFTPHASVLIIMHGLYKEAENLMLFRPTSVGLILFGKVIALLVLTG